MRRVLSLNNGWYYKAPYENGFESIVSIEGFEKVNLPHTNVELPYNYFNEEDFMIVSCYKYPLNISEDYKDKLIYVHFEGVMAYTKVYLNGVFLGEHKGGYTPFDIRIDKEYRFELENNMLTVIVDSSEIPEIPPFGGQIDYLTYGGIYREVSLGIYDKVFIKNIKTETNKVLEDEKDLRIFMHVENPYDISGEADIRLCVNEKCGNEVFSGNFKVNIEKGKRVYDFNINNLKDIMLWDIDSPELYEITAKLDIREFSDEGTAVFGFRTCEFTAEGFYLNGRKIKLRGLNRHQSYPYVGYAMPKRVQEMDAKILKNELHLNLVRTSHYPQSKHFINKCDELGLMVFEEIPGWQHIGNEEWKDNTKVFVREMIERDWNHPSIILWGVRINESQDDDVFYTDTNKIAHDLDGTRQTGGVRCITDSRLLEDVYTFNDFIHNGTDGPLRDQQVVTGLSRKVPYMVTEYNGHMFPTKRFDQEERQMEHSLRHLRIQNAAGLDDSISGAIGWCAFDYNTHKDFGSGDRICYHGVMDMFRLPKFAAPMYGSQVSPDVEPVLSPVTFWARGERNIGGVIPLVIFTNCDYIEFQYGSYPAKRVYPAKEAYKGVQYPPVIIDFSVISFDEAGAWGMQWEDAVIKGYYRDEVVIEKKLSKAPVPSELFVSPDERVLDSKEKDAVRIVVKILDQYGNLLPFIDDVINIEVLGPARLQGPNTAAVKGGALAFWVETINEPGEINITVKSSVLGQKGITLKVE